jgi:hypothetical protein
MNFRKILLALFIIKVSTFAQAHTDVNKTITSVGVQYNSAYITVSPQTSKNCLFNVLYIFGLDKASGKSLYNLALSSYVLGNQIKRIDYDIDASGACYITLLNF